MKRTPLRKEGAKAAEWKKARVQLIAELKKTGKYIVTGSKVMGECQDCRQFTYLTADHRKKRSQGGGHEAENIDWVCWPCHDKRDNMGDPKEKKETTIKKPDWQKPHTCKECKEKNAGMLLCPSCGKISV